MDVLSDERMLPWRERYLAHGWRAGASFPLRSEALPGGVLNVYAPVAGAFGPDEAAVLEDLAATIGFALDALAEKAALEASEARYRIVIEQNADGILVSDASGRYVEANAALCRMLGYTRQEILDLYTPSLRAADDPLTP